MQICLMRDIYRQATVVQVWLGPMLSKADLDVFPIFEMMAQGIRIRKLYHQHFVGRIGSPISLEDFKKTYAPDDALNGPAAADGVDAEFFGKLPRFFDLGWWDRLWVLQEVVVARKVLLRWGTNTIALTTLFDSHGSMRADLRRNYHVTANAIGRGVIEEYLKTFTRKLDLIQYLQSLQSTP